MAAPKLYVDCQTSAKYLFAQEEKDDTGITPYIRERQALYTQEKWDNLLKRMQYTKTLYIGNLSFYTTEEQLYEFFSTVGPVRRVIMGLNKLTKTPCGFCFVEYYTHEDALACQRHLHGAHCDERPLTAALDPGFEEGRQYGRSARTGGQRRDDFRNDFDAGRGGWSSELQMTTFNAMPTGNVAHRPKEPYKFTTRKRAEELSKLQQ